MGETRKNSHHLHSEQWLSLQVVWLTCQSAMANIRQRGVLNHQPGAISWRMGRYAWERKCSFSAVEMIDDHTRCPESNQITHEWHSWLCFKIFLCKYLGPQDCRLCKRQWRCHFLQIPIPISERKRDGKYGPSNRMCVRAIRLSPNSILHLAKDAVPTPWLSQYYRHPRAKPSDTAQYPGE